MGTEELLGKPDEILGGNLVIDWHHPGGSSYTPCRLMLYGNWERLQLRGPEDWSTDFIFTFTYIYSC